MKHLITVLLILCCIYVADGTLDRVAARTGANGVSFAALKKEFDDAFLKFREEGAKKAMDQFAKATAERKAAEKALQEAKTEEEKAAAKKRIQAAMPAMMMISMADGPGAVYAPRFLKFAETHPKDPAAVDSLIMALRTSGGPSAKNGIWNQAIDNLRTSHVANPEIKKALQDLAMPGDEAANILLRDIVAKNPDRKIQARACKALAKGLADAADRGDRFKDDSEFRKRAETQLGKVYIEKLIGNASAARKEADGLSRMLREKYSDVLPDLSIGAPAPEVLSKDTDRKLVKLSALKGKVVVLDIWATWCGPCRAMIPHERAMVARLKDKPFVLVSISADEDLETLTAFLGKEKMPWTHWWNGNEGGLLEDWDIHAFPTIFVLDAKGVIRYRDIRGEKLEEAVNELLQELGSNATK